MRKRRGRSREGVVVEEEEEEEEGEDEGKEMRRRDTRTEKGTRAKNAHQSRSSDTYRSQFQEAHR